MELIEVQSGVYLSEEDIMRFEGGCGSTKEQQRPMTLGT
jgi:hypothetical protein